MSCSFSVTRVCRARIVVITESRRGFKPGHWRETAARRRRAGVHRRACKAPIAPSSWMRVCRVRWPDYWQAARWASPGRYANTHSQPARRPGDSGR